MAVLGHLLDLGLSMLKVSKLLVPLILGMVLSFMFQQVRQAWPAEREPHLGHPAPGEFDPYASLIDPVYHNQCCGRDDCSEVPASWVQPVPGGWLVNLSLEQARQITPATNEAVVNAFVAVERAIPSTDGKYHMCVYNYGRAEPRRGVICLVVPAGS